MAATTSAADGSRPDPGAGVFETILVVGGFPVELEAHMTRLETSLRALYRRVPGGLAELVREEARGGDLGRLRLSVAPGRDGALAASVVVAPFDPNNVFPTATFATALKVYVLETGWGDHKWADREVLTRAEAAAGPGFAPLLVDPTGRVLEGSRANVFAVVEGVVLTPPLDGGILPGVARAGLIEEAARMGTALREEPIDLDALKAADEVFLTGSLRGVEPIHEVDGVAIPTGGAVTTALAAALRKRWRLPAAL